MNRNSSSKSRNSFSLTSIIAALLINFIIILQFPIINSLAAEPQYVGYRVEGPASTWTTTDQSKNSTSFVVSSTTQTKISGYLYDAATKNPIPDIEIELSSNNATVVSRYSTSSATGYYEFDFTSVQEIYSSNTDLYLKGELSISDPIYKTKYTVSYTNAGNYLSANNQEVHELVYIYKDRTVWNDTSQHQNFVLIPPLQVPLPQDINPSETPLLLVHGLGGTGNYWEGIRKLLSVSPYSSQVWEVFYPVDGRISESASLVKDAVDTLLLNYDSTHQQVDMVGHSMGGPVTLAYVQGLARYPHNAPLVNYVPRVRKLLQLSPANHGSIHASRLIADALSGTSSCTTKLFNLLYTNDPLEPAHQDLALGSEFMQELFTSINNSGLAINPSNFLVITGTDSSILPQLELLLFTQDCTPGKGQSDVFISASSASLLNFSVPLGLVYLDHSETRGTRKITLQNQTDYPETPAQAQPLVNMIGNFFLGNTQIVRNNLDLYIDPSSNPLDPTKYLIYEYGTLQSSPLGADQWNDGYSDTFFNAGSLWISATDFQGNPISDELWITDGNLYYKMHRSSTDIWYLDSSGVVDINGNPVNRDERHWGEIAPAGAFGKTYLAYIHAQSGDISLGNVTIYPSITNFVELREPDMKLISGFVRTSGGAGISGVVLNGLPGTPVSDVNGFYSRSVPSGWSGTVVPTKTNYTFSPSSITYSNVTSDQANQNYLRIYQTFLPIVNH